jgi:hypothetical protein
LNVTGEATWPTYTNVSYPIFNDDGTYYLDPSGIDYFDDYEPYRWTTFTDNLDLSGSNYYYSQMDETTDWSNYGWPEPLEYDECAKRVIYGISMY